jgi:hypothetical protein
MYGPLDEEDVMGIRKTQFLRVCSSPEFQLYFANRNKPMVNPAKRFGFATPFDFITAQGFCCGVKCDMTHYKELKEDKHFNFLEPWFYCNSSYASYAFCFGCKLWSNKQN